MQVSPLLLITLAHTLEVEGFNAGEVLRRCGVPSLDALQKNGEWVPVELLDRMMAAVMEETGDASFGLVAGKSIALMRYDVLVPLVLSTPNLRQLLADLRQLSPLALPVPELELVETPRACRLVVKAVVQGGQSRHFRTEMLATSSLQLLKFARASHADIYEVELSYPCPEAQEARYVATFGPHIRFGSHECAIHFNPALLDSPMPTHDPLAYASARTRAEAVLRARLAQSDMAERVRRWLLGAFPRQPSTAETADHLNVSERSLRRELAKLGVSHADLAQASQRLMAERLLADGSAALNQVADMLGFSSASSFHRAFRRWTGLTPSVWRESRGSMPS